MTSNFKHDLKRGAAGEDRIAKMFPKWTRNDGRKQDFTTDKGILIEVKTESRTTLQTPNVALEVESSPGRPGAIQRAVSDGVSVVLYLFSDDKLFAYDAVGLLAFMTFHEGVYRTVKIPNKNYHTTVMIVPREALKDVEVERETYK